MTIITKFTRQLGLNHPVMSAPMGTVSGGRLAAAVSNVGGLGMVGVGYGNKEWLRRELELVRKSTNRPWGVGFITWCITQEIFDLVMAYAPHVVMFSFGDMSPWVKQVKAKNIPVFSQVHDLNGAIDAHSKGADFIVAQGCEAGGHGTGARGTFSLVRGIKKQSLNLPIIAAGGIADGATLAAALNTGADAVSMGTRFYASFEAFADYRMKERLVECSGDDTIRTEVFDIVREIAWPKGYNARAITNKFVALWHGNERDLKLFKTKHKPTYLHAQEHADPKIAAVWAGEGIDYINDIKDAADIVREVIKTAKIKLI
ncbi:NAD(P)H-dependent flavin oxidoreductase [Methylophaga thiooxydans]|uniref:NAD(P)H-dependent flavin oxidoreductase n=1 Tax=Methylophaga thiooxydans TaxID=392484 RepID=UPI0023553392|nr:nitronate monooxygenase [Methylophaga thiooxydans]